MEKYDALIRNEGKMGYCLIASLVFILLATALSFFKTSEAEDHPYPSFRITKTAEVAAVIG